VKISRPLPDSGMREYGHWLAAISWAAVLAPANSTDDQDDILKCALANKMEEIFPEKKCRVSNQDVSFITAEMKKLQMYMLWEYKSKGQSAKYHDIKKKYECKFKKAAENQLSKFVEDMMEEHPGKAYIAMKKMGARPGDCENDGEFTIL